MKFIKLIWYDIHQGILRKPKVVLLGLLLGTVFSANLLIDISNIDPHGMIYKLGSADYLFYIFGGIREYIPAPDDPFLFPVVWILGYLTLFFITLNYPYNDMETIGQQVLIRTRGRVLWWLSKCVWNLLNTILFSASIVAAVLLFCLFFRIPFTTQFDMNFLLDYNRMRISEKLLSPDVILPFRLLFLPFAVAICMSLAQMTFTLFLKPVFSFGAASVIMLASSYLLSPFLIGNYAMPIRSDKMITNGVNANVGVLFSALIFLICIAAGIVRFRRYDILSRED